MNVGWISEAHPPNRRLVDAAQAPYPPYPSRHLRSVEALGVAVALGATVIEKHFTLRRADGGVDSAFSLEPEELRALVVESERAWQALGKVSYGATEAEENSKVYRRSLYIVRDLKAGDILTPDNLRIIRPGFGLPPKDYERLLGKRVNREVKRGTAVEWEYVG
jgi:sialic acid synthase SpsE